MARPFRRRIISVVHRAYSHDPHERVDAVSGTNSDRTRWTLSQAAAIAAIEAGTDEFFVDASGETIRVVVQTHGGQKYLKSEREKTHPDDLLRLAR
jgi:Protein of unknown function (DUF3892)